MNRQAFFSAVRISLFSGRLLDHQVKGTEYILDAWERFNLADKRWLAYILATTFHETARTMQPIKERGGAAYFTRMYDITGDRPHVARRLGNTQRGDGARYAGRGFVQITGRTNYAKASKAVGQDLIANPDLAMRADIAAYLLIEGMRSGWYTGKRLQDYIFGHKCDYRNARRIINGVDKAAVIASYAEKFEAAIEAALAVSERVVERVHVAPPEVRDLIEEADVTSNIGSKTNIATGVLTVSSVTQAGKEVIMNVDDMMKAAPWLLLAVLCIAFAGYIWWSRNQKKNKARSARHAVADLA